MSGAVMDHLTVQIIFEDFFGTFFFPQKYCVIRKRDRSSTNHDAGPASVLDWDAQVMLMQDQLMHRLMMVIMMMAFLVIDDDFSRGHEMFHDGMIMQT